MEIVEHLKFLVVNMLKQLTTNTSMLVRKEGPTKTLLPQEGETKIPQKLLLNFYRSTVETILTNCATVCCASCTVPERKEPKVAQGIVKMELPQLDTI